MNKFGYLLTGAIMSPILLWSAEIVVFIIGLTSIAITGSMLAEELQKIENEEKNSD